MVKLCHCGHDAATHGQGNSIVVRKRYPCAECLCANYDRKFDPFPDVCPDCGGDWMKMGGVIATLVGYFSQNGHKHDDNCRSRTILCANGHRFKLGIRRRCESHLGCEWKGRETCWCESFAKVDVWPELKYEERLW